MIPVISIAIVFSRSESIVAAPQADSGPAVASQPPTDAAADAPSVKIEIANEPKSIDPATLMNPRLAAPTTVAFDGVSLKELYRWLQEDQKLSVSIDAAAMKEKGILSSELVTDRLANEPLYLILDRLKSLGIGWYEADGDLFLTTVEASSHTMKTESYNLGELLDAGYESDRIVEVISSATGGTLIENGDEEGSVVLLGDVVFVRQTQRVQQEVRGVLAGLKQPARRTLTLDPPQHALLREKLVGKISLTLEEVPLSEAIAELAQVSGTDIRLNGAELKTAGVRDRSPVSINMVDQKLSLVLQSALSELHLTWLLQDGVIWIVQKATAESAERTAIFDVRDLCRDEVESDALKYALMEQTGGVWQDNGDEHGVLVFARPGILVVRHTEQMLDKVLKLLENYRTALRESKPRKKAGPDPKEVLTYYYRLPTDMAKELQLHLSELVRPETWKADDAPDAAGTIKIMKSTPDLLDSFGRSVVSGNIAAGQLPGNVLVVDNSVLIIRQMREVHEEINDLLNKLTRGERPDFPKGGGFGGGGMGGGMGGGGFGGGFFNVP